MIVGVDADVAVVLLMLGDGIWAYELFQTQTIKNN